MQGYAPVPYLPDDFGEDTNLPDDTTNAQRSTSVGPTRYTIVLSDGNRRPAVDGFLAFMNVQTSGSVLRDPAVLALKFAINGETVARETFHATLNGADVTSHADGRLVVEGLEAARIGDLAAAEGLRLHELTPARASLEDAFMELTRDSVEHRAVAS